MKLTHNIEKSFLSELVDLDIMENELLLLRKMEDKFYKVFDLNPCPMAISDFETHKIIDVNEAFIKIIELDNKNEILGKDTCDFFKIK
jgi:hypothetical protein